VTGDGREQICEGVCHERKIVIISIFFRVDGSEEICDGVLGERKWKVE